MTEAFNGGATYFTGHELCYLLDMEDSAGSRMSRQRLGLPSDVDDEIVIAGAATLFVRELAQIMDEVVRPVGAAVVLAQALCTATSWIEIGLIRPDLADAMVLIGSETTGLILMPGELGTFSVLFAETPENLRKAGRLMVETFLSEPLDGGVTIRVITESAEESAGLRVQDGQADFFDRVPAFGDEDTAQPPTWTGPKTAGLAKLLELL